MIDPKDLCLCPGRVGQRAEDIEDRPAPQFLPYRHDMAHGGVMVWCKEECDTDLFDDLCLVRRINCEVHAKCREHICGTAGAADAPVPVFYHRDTCTCRYQCRCGADIEGVRTVTAGTAGIDQCFLGDRCYRHRMLAHHPCKCCNLLRCLSLHAECGQECADLGLRGAALHDGAHDLSRFFRTRDPAVR